MDTDSTGAYSKPNKQKKTKYLTTAHCHRHRHRHRHHHHHHQVPDRQRTLRELEIGRTLVKVNERWVIKHSAADYKTGDTYGDRPPLELDASLYVAFGPVLLAI